MATQGHYRKGRDAGSHQLTWRNKKKPRHSGSLPDSATLISVPVQLAAAPVSVQKWMMSWCGVAQWFTSGNSNSLALDCTQPAAKSQICNKKSSSNLKHLAHYCNHRGSASSNEQQETFPPSSLFLMKLVGLTSVNTLRGGVGARFPHIFSWANYRKSETIHFDSLLLTFTFQK